MAIRKTKLAIFDTFKTNPNKITGEGNRQRAIIRHLANATNSASKTRTAISQTIAEDNKILWKNIYSGIFRDLDEVLIPLAIVEEEGRLPLKRGPKALQENGMPYYHLTKKGILVALSILKTGDTESMMNEFFAGEYYDTEEIPVQEMITKLYKIAPNFTLSLFEKYTKSYCDGKMPDLLPFNIENMKLSADNSSHLQMELLEGFVKMTNSERQDALDFLKKIE